MCPGKNKFFRIAAKSLNYLAGSHPIVPGDMRICFDGNVPHFTLAPYNKEQGGEDKTDTVRHWFVQHDEPLYR